MSRRDRLPSLVQTPPGVRPIHQLLVQLDTSSRPARPWPASLAAKLSRAWFRPRSSWFRYAAHQYRTTLMSDPVDSEVSRGRGKRRSPRPGTHESACRLNRNTAVCRGAWVWAELWVETWHMRRGEPSPDRGRLGIRRGRGRTVSRDRNVRQVGPSERASDVSLTWMA